jgi:hypothetical protein
MQLASILPPPSVQRECYIQLTVTMPGVEGHIVLHSKHDTHIMVVFLILSWPIPMIVPVGTQL